MNGVKVKDEGDKGERVFVYSVFSTLYFLRCDTKRHYCDLYFNVFKSRPCLLRQYVKWVCPPLDSQSHSP